MPGGGAVALAGDVLRNIVVEEFEWKLTVTLLAKQVPNLRLGDADARLGWMSWLGPRRSARDADDLVLKHRALNAAIHRSGEKKTGSSRVGDERT